MSKPFLLQFRPGSQHDGTNFDSNAYFDLLWCRFRLGKPRKMGGYKTITDSIFGIPRKVHMFYLGQYTYIHIGSVGGIQQVVIDQNGNLISIADRTPTSGFASGNDIGFTFDAIFDTTSGVVQLVAHAVPDVRYLANATTTVPFIGQIDSPLPLAEFSDPGAPSGVWTQPRISGGVVCIQPFVFDFSSDGWVQWCAPNLPLYLGVVGGSTGAGEARISAQKVVAGMPLRGGGSQSPAGVFWSLSEVITATFVGQDSGSFRFNTVSPSSSILSSDAVVEYDSLYFWAAVDRFLVFNGTVTEVPNTQNQDWFFNNLTPGFEAHTFAFKVPRYGEIWWCACMFGATTPNYAVIFNLRENCWYDTRLPDVGRSAAYYAQGVKFPVMGGQDSRDGLYKLWRHETGVDDVDGTAIRPVRSYFETAWFGGPKVDPPNDQALSIQQLEPDFVQTGDMEVYLIGAPNIRAPENKGPTLPLLQIPSERQEEFVSFTPTQSQRISRLHVESNVIGGNYIAGRNIMHGDTAEGRKIF